MTTIKDVELVKDAVAKLRPGYDLVFRAFVCYVCEETLPLIIEGRSDDTCAGAQDCCICGKYIGLVCIPCEEAVGVEAHCCVCGKERGYREVRCKQESCQQAEIPDKLCFRCELDQERAVKKMIFFATGTSRR